MPIKRHNHSTPSGEYTLWSQLLDKDKTDNENNMLLDPKHPVWSDRYGALKMCILDHTNIRYVNDTLKNDEQWWIQALRVNRGFIGKTPKKHMSSVPVLYELMRSKPGRRYLRERQKETKQRFGSQDKELLELWLQQKEHRCNAGGWIDLWESRCIQDPQVMEVLLKSNMQQICLIQSNDWQYYGYALTVQANDSDSKKVSKTQEQWCTRLESLGYTKQQALQKHQAYVKVGQMLLEQVLSDRALGDSIWEQLSAYIETIHPWVLKILKENPKKYLDLSVKVRSDPQMALQVLDSIDVHLWLEESMFVDSSVLEKCLQKKYPIYERLVQHQDVPSVRCVLEDKTLMDQMLRTRPSIWRDLLPQIFELHEQLKKDVGYIEGMLLENGLTWRLLTQEDQENRHYMLLAIQSVPVMLSKAPASWLEEEDFMDQCIQVQPICVQFAPQAYRKRLDKMLPLVKKHPQMYIHLRGATRIDEQVISSVLSQDARNLYRWLPEEKKANPMVVLEALSSTRPVSWREVHPKIIQKIRTCLPKNRQIVDTLAPERTVADQMLQLLRGWCARKQKVLLEKVVAHRSDGINRHHTRRI